MSYYEQYMDILKKRRRMKLFTDQVVTDEDILKIIDAARCAPSGANSQPWEFIVVRGKERIQEIIQTPDVDNGGHQSGKKQPPKQATNADILIVAVADRRKLIAFPWQDYTFENGKIALKEAKPFINVEKLLSISMSNAIMQMIIAVAALGLSSQYVSNVAADSSQNYVKELLNIPDYMMVFEAIAVGYAGYDFKDKDTRPLGEIIHYDNFDMSKVISDQEIVEQFCAMKAVNKKSDSGAKIN